MRVVKGLTSVKGLTVIRHLSYVGHMAVMTRGVAPQWTLSDRVRKAREHAGLSQQELAERLSITRTSVVNWERGHTRPLRALLVALADTTGVDPAWLTYEGPGDPISSRQTGIPAGMSGQPGGYGTVDNEITRMRKPIEERIPLRRSTPETITPLADVVAIWGAAA